MNARQWALMTSFLKLLNFSLFVFCISQPLAWSSVEASLSGIILDESRIALPSVTVRLFNVDTKQVREEITSSFGSYQFFPIPLGDYHVFIVASGMKSYQYDVHLSAGGSSHVEVLLVHERAGSSEQEMVVEVKAKKKMLQTHTSTSSHELNRARISQMPQGGEISLPKLIAITTPGVVQGGFGQIFVRGNHANIQYQIDGVQMPDSPSNAFGQAFSPRNIEQMETITGGMPAEYGQRTSAVVNILTQSGQEKPGGEIELNYGSYNTISPHLLYGGSSESGSIHYFLSLNYNQTDRGLNTPQPQSESNQFQGGTDSVHNNSSGDSEFGKIDWQLNNENKFSFIIFNSRINYQIPNYPPSFQSTDPYFQSTFGSAWGMDSSQTSPLFVWVPSQTNNTQFERNTYFQVVWKRTLKENSFLQLAPYYKYSNIIVTNDLTNDLASLYFNPLNPVDPNNSPGATQAGSFPIPASQPSSFSQNRYVNNIGLKGDYFVHSGERHFLKTGFQIQASRADGVASLQQNLGTSPSMSADPTVGYSESLYIQDDFTIFKPLVLNAGLRFDATQFVFAGLSPSDSLLQPRVGLNYMATETTRFHVFYGKLFQAAPVENLRVISQTGGVLVAYNIKAEKDDYYEAGVAQQIFDQQVLSINAYYRNAVDVIDEHQLLRTAIAQPFNFAKGYGYGLEFSIQGKLSRDWSEYFNYSYTVAKGSNGSGGILPSGAFSGTIDQTLDHVQDHTANLGLTYAKSSFLWTGQILYGSGLRTGPSNTVSLPPHFTLDTTVGYQFRGQSEWSRFRLSADILNVLGNIYPITVANGFTGSQYASGRQYFLRISKEI